ncbi:tRNA-dihydrouridine synthase C [Planctomycetes bacterium Pan216]|uniref:tRNA-dihydrouridine synthase n=1 Tax=Kolteria novifilia TaxID=2527975 RepID=A0A518AX16_9BACT|nr:tRNA-dihydrouridine synthase C [Planctomycetes bacterium Pan216]
MPADTAVSPSTSEASSNVFPLPSPFTLAALSGYSDLGMRVTCRSLGACLTRHEVVLDQCVLKGSKGARSGTFLEPSDRPIAAQLMGNDPEQMGLAAARMVAEGYDLVDINFGCPVKKVLGRCRGGFLLGEPETAIEMIQRVRDAVTVPVTIKVRRGRDDSREATESFWRIIDEAVDLGVVGVAIHGRTVDQRYEGQACWNRIAEVKRRHPHLVVFGSGDLFTAEDCLRMLEQTGCDGVTIARGAIANPWIFRESLALWKGLLKPAPPTIREQGELIDWQYRLAVTQYGPERASRQMRKFGIKRAALHPRADELHQAYIRLSQLSDWHALMNEFYATESTAISA